MVDFEFETEGDFVPGSTTEWDVFSLLPGGDYEQPEYLATLYSAYQKTIRVELDGSGAGSFAINRTSPECTETILAQGNLVKVRIPEIHDDYIFAFFLEAGDFTLISSQEAGGEALTFGGRGILSYLEYARAWAYSYITGGQDPIAGVWRAYAAGTGSAPGQILRRLIEEFQHIDRGLPGALHYPIPHLTVDFDYDDDSTADPWDTTDATDEFAYQVGEDGLAIVQRLIDTQTITVQMSPDFVLSAYNPDNYGRDLSGAAFGADIVRFERGVNIATELRRELAVTELQTHMLAAGEDDKYGTAALSDAADRVTKEGYIAAFGTGTTALNGIAAAELQTRLGHSDTIMFPIANRRTADVVLSDPVSVGAPLGLVATDGYYLPGPEGTLGDFWVGDTVRVHTGSGPFDYTEVDALVKAITITREDENAELIVIPELTTSVSPIVPIEQFGTEAGSAEAPFTWPEGIPGPGNLLVGFLATRGGGVADPDMVPWSTVTYGAPVPGIAGTEWTQVTSFPVTDDPSEGTKAVCAMAWRESTIDDTLFISWEGITGGTARPRSHQMEIAGLVNGAPTVTATSSEQTAPGTTYTSPDITVPEAGYIIAGFHYDSGGPADWAGWPGYTMTPDAPAQGLTSGWCGSDFGGFSWFGYIYVAAAGTYHIDLERTDAVGWPHAYFLEEYGWIMGFWAGPESAAFPA